jgi:hypothetical protein
MNCLVTISAESQVGDPHFPSRSQTLDISSGSLHASIPSPLDLETSTQSIHLDHRHHHSSPRISSSTNPTSDSSSSSNSSSFHPTSLSPFAFDRL